MVGIRVYADLGLYGCAFWLLGSLIGVLTAGPLSDRVGRKPTLLAIHGLTALVLGCILLYGWSRWLALAIGLVCVPNAPARGALVDALPAHSLSRVMSGAMLVKFLPWCFFLNWTALSNEVALEILLGGCLLNLGLLMTLKMGPFATQKRQPELDRQPFLLMAFGFLLAETTYYHCDMMMRMGQQGARLVPAIGAACLFGTMIHLFFRPAVPAARLLRWCYGVGSTVCTMSCLCLLFMVPGLREVRLLVLILCGLSGFYIPLTYDIGFSWLGNRRYGLAGGLLGGAQVTAALLALGIGMRLHPSPTVIMGTISLTFIAATLVQYVAELSAMQGIASADEHSPSVVRYTLYSTSDSQKTG